MPSPRYEPAVACAAIVPAYNEEETLTDVLTVLRATSLVSEVLLVSDGSTDHTTEVARALGVKTIHLRRNRGKGLALAAGVARTSAPVLVFVDGDILNLSGYLLEQLILPVLDGRCDMNIGIRHRGWLIDAFHRRTGPLLSGIRCLRREVFAAVPDGFLEGYRVETALNWSCRRLGRRARTTVLHQIKHRVKEKKRGVLGGLAARARMFREVLGAHLRLRFGLRRPRSAPLLEAEVEYINF